MCLLPSVWDVWLDSARQSRARTFPTTDRCVNSKSALETQPCHLRHTAVSIPLMSSGSEMSQKKPTVSRAVLNVFGVKVILLKFQEHSDFVLSRMNDIGFVVLSKHKII